MNKTQIVNSSRTYAAIRAQRSNVANQAQGFTNEVAKAAMAHALELYDADLAGAPVKPVRQPVDRKLAAYRAHRTMLQARIKGTRGKARTEMQSKLAHYEQLLAA
jgi:hypothetical protein